MANTVVWPLIPDLKQPPREHNTYSTEETPFSNIEEQYHMIATRRNQQPTKFKKALCEKKTHKENFLAQLLMMVIYACKEFYYFRLTENLV